MTQYIVIVLQHDTSIPQAYGPYATFIEAHRDSQATQVAQKPYSVSVAPLRNVASMPHRSPITT